MASLIASKRSPKFIYFKWKKKNQNYLKNDFESQILALFDTYLTHFNKSIHACFCNQCNLNFNVKSLLTFSIWTWYLSYFETLNMYVVYFNLKFVSGYSREKHQDVSWFFKTGILSTDRFIWARTKIYLLLYFQVGVGFDLFVSGAQ